MKKIICILCSCMLLSGCSYDNSESNPRIDSNFTETIPINESVKKIEEKDISVTSSNELQKNEIKIDSRIINPKTFYKDLLKSENERKVYEALYSAFLSKSTLVEIPALETSKIKEIYEYVRLDNPELFYIPKMFNIIKSEGIKFNISLKYSSIDVGYMKELADKIIDKMPKSQSEYMKAKYIYKTIVDTSTYSSDNIGIYSMLVDGKGSCEGYSELFKYLCDKIGIDSIIVTGQSRESAHQWNMVKIDGKWYHVDVTWGDPLNGVSNYDYFCLNQEEISRSHTIDRLDVLPLANSIDSNYFVKSGLILDSVEYSDIYVIFKRAASIDPELISFRMENEDIFNENIKNIEGWIYKALKNIGYTGNHITYNTNDELYILNINIF